MSGWSDMLMCSVDRVSYDYAQKVGEIWLPPDNCTDMKGAIRMMTGFDPEVKTIITWAGGRRDTVYFREGGKWEARK